MTTERLLNIKEKGMFGKKKYVKRGIDLTKIESITYSKTSFDFVVHVPMEYDYHLFSEERDNFLGLLILLIEKKGKSKIWIYFVEDMNL